MLGRLRTRASQNRANTANAARPDGQAEASITATQRAAYLDTFGAVVIPGAFRADFARIEAGFERVFAREQSDAVDPDSDYFRNAVPEDGRIKFAFNLDPLTRASGALRVIPGTQHLGPFGAGLFDEAANVAPDHLERKFGTPDDALRHWPLEVMPGDLVIFDNAALHAWFGGHSRRRMFSVQFREATKPVSPRSES